MYTQIEYINKTVEFDLRKKLYFSSIIKLFGTSLSIQTTEQITKKLVVYYGKYTHRNIIGNIQIRKY